MKKGHPTMHASFEINNFYKTGLFYRAGGPIFNERYAHKLIGSIVRDAPREGVGASPYIP